MPILIVDVQTEKIGKQFSIREYAFQLYSSIIDPYFNEIKYSNSSELWSVDNYVAGISPLDRYNQQAISCKYVEMYQFAFQKSFDEAFLKVSADSDKFYNEIYNKVYEQVYQDLHNYFQQGTLADKVALAFKQAVELHKAYDNVETLSIEGTTKSNLNQNHTTLIEPTTTSPRTFYMRHGVICGESKAVHLHGLKPHQGESFEKCLADFNTLYPIFITTSPIIFVFGHNKVQPIIDILYILLGPNYIISKWTNKNATVLTTCQNKTITICNLEKTPGNEKLINSEDSKDVFACCRQSSHQSRCAWKNVWVISKRFDSNLKTILSHLNEISGINIRQVVPQNHGPVQ